MIDENAPIPARFDHLRRMVSSPRFLNKQGLGNEVPFFICPYKIEQDYEVKQMIKQLVNNLNQNGVRILHIDLYDLVIELLKQRGIWERVLQTEPEVTKNHLKELLQGVLDPEKYLIPAISARMDASDFDVLFLNGVGEIYPYIRSHNVLNNLQSSAKEKPTVLFFPGTYTYSPEEGAALNLFGILHNDKYYRAFNIYHYEI
jgi:hypothetical protein